MASINSLPQEIILLIAGQLKLPPRCCHPPSGPSSLHLGSLHLGSLHLSSLAALARTNRKLYDAVNPLLYEADVSTDCTSLKGAALTGCVGTLERFLLAGGDVNFEFDETVSQGFLPLRHCSRLHSRRPHPPIQGADHVRPVPTWSGEQHAAFRPIVDQFELVDKLACKHFINPHSSIGHLTSSLAPLGLYDADDADVAVLHDMSYSALHLAARQGHSLLIEALLRHGAHIDPPSVLFCACSPLSHSLNEDWKLYSREGAPVGFALLLDGGTPAWTPLHVAVCFGHTQSAQLLLRHGASTIVERDVASACAARYRASTCLHHAARWGDSDLIKHLVQEGYQQDIDVSDSSSLTPLHYALIGQAPFPAIKLLADLGADLDKFLYIPTVHFGDFGDDFPLTVPITSDVADISITPLFEACYSTNYSSAMALIDLGADVNGRCQSHGKAASFGVTPLQICCQYPDVDFEAGWDDNPYPAVNSIDTNRCRVIKALIAHGASIDERRFYKRTPLSLTAGNALLPAFMTLLNAGADVHLRGKSGRTVLMDACVSADDLPFSRSLDRWNRLCSPVIVNQLLQRGLPIDAVDDDGNTALQLVCQRDYSEAWLGYHKARDNDAVVIARLLLAKGADPNIRGRIGQSLLGDCLARKVFAKNDLSLCSLLTRHGATIPPWELKRLFSRQVYGTDPERDEKMTILLDLDHTHAILSDGNLFCDTLDQLANSAWPERFFDQGSLHLTPEQSSRALRLAVDKPNYPVLLRLVTAGADVSTFYPDIGTLLHRSIEMRNLGVIKVLALAGADIHRVPPGGGYPTALEAAIRTGRPAFVEALFHACSTDKPPNADALPDYLHIAAGSQDWLPVEEMLLALIRHGWADHREKKDANGDTPLSLFLQSLARPARGLEELRGVLTPFDVDDLPVLKAYDKALFRPLALLLSSNTDMNYKNIVGMSIGDYLEYILSYEGEEVLIRNVATALHHRLDIVVEHDGFKRIHWRL